MRTSVPPALQPVAELTRQLRRLVLRAEALEHAADTGGIVISTVMNLVHLIALRTRVRAAAAAEVVDVRPDDERCDVWIGLLTVRQHCEHVAALLLLLLDDNVRRERAGLHADGDEGRGGRQLDRTPRHG